MSEDETQAMINIKTTSSTSTSTETETEMQTETAKRGPKEAKEQKSKEVDKSLPRVSPPEKYRG